VDTVARYTPPTLSELSVPPCRVAYPPQYRRPIFELKRAKTLEKILKIAKISQKAEKIGREMVVLVGNTPVYGHFGHPKKGTR